MVFFSASSAASLPGESIGRRRLHTHPTGAFVGCCPLPGRPAVLRDQGCPGASLKIRYNGGGRPAASEGALVDPRGLLMPKWYVLPWDVGSLGVAHGGYLVCLFFWWGAGDMCSVECQNQARPLQALPCSGGIGANLYLQVISSITVLCFIFYWRNFFSSL